MSSPDFPVGSIVYFLHNKTERVLPAQVVEKIVRTSLDGSKSTYIIAVQSKDSVKKIEVDPEKVHMFQTPAEMTNFMVVRATEAITVLVAGAVKASEVFGVAQQVEEPPKDDMADISVSRNPGDDPEDYESWHVPAAERPISKSSKKQQYAEIDLGNGQKGRLKV